MKMEDEKYMWKKLTNFIRENYKFLLILLLIFAVFEVELPYKIYTPGGMVNLENRVKVENGYETKGKLGMAYVSMVRGSIPFLLLSYIIPDWDVVPVSELTLDNESFEERFEADKIATQQSIDAAIISSFTLAGKKIEVKKETVHVTYIDEQAKTDLKVFDIVEKIDGKEIKNSEELRSIVESHQEHDTITLQIQRNGEEKEATAEVFLMEGISKIGIQMTVTYEYEENPKASIKMKSSESGPSGGLMMALSLYNSLVEEDITKGKKIIGTGTIDVLGNVGEIGGIRYKLIGAVNKKADVFLVPKENYEEALEVKNEKNYDIKLISVSTLEEAIKELKNI